MLQKSRQLALPQKVISYYLLFSLTALVCVLVGGAWASRRAILHGTARRHLEGLEKIESSLVLSLLRNDQGRAKELLREFGETRELLACAALDENGQQIAEWPEKWKAGLPLEENSWRIRWNGLSGRHISHGDRPASWQFRIPLKAQQEKVGTLVVAIAEPDLSSAWIWGKGLGPWVVCGSLFLLAAGAVALNRLVAPFRKLEHQLREAAIQPVLSDFAPPTLPGNLAVLRGWNRVVEHLRAQAESHEWRKRLREALENRQAQKVEAILQSLPDGIAATDLEGRILFANDVLRALVAPDGENALEGRNIHECWKLADMPRTAQELFNEPSQRTCIQEIPSGEGEDRRVLRISRQPLRSSDSETGVGHVWTVRDVTQQKLANKMRDQFLDSATHELRTPLANIKAYAETLVLSDMADVEQQKDFCNTINAEATRLARLIDDLLSISSIEVGSLTLTRQNVDLERLLKEVITKVRPQMEQKHITFECHLPAKFPSMHIDKDKISATLINLLGNAAKYTPAEGRVTMRIRIEQDQLLVDIADTGIGIAEEDLPHVFDKFFRGQDQRVQHESGTGLGLSLAREVVQLHGGKLTVQSEWDKGSTFTVSLPVA